MDFPLPNHFFVMISYMSFLPGDVQQQRLNMLTPVIFVLKQCCPLPFFILAVENPVLVGFEKMRYFDFTPFLAVHCTPSTSPGVEIFTASV